MGHSKELITRINNFFQSRGFPLVSSEMVDLKLIFEKSLENIWVNISNKAKRFSIGKEISDFFVNFYGNNNTITIFNELINMLNEKYPGTEDYKELYRSIIEDYENQMNRLITDEIFSLTILEDIIKKILIIVEQYKDQIITFISEEKEYNHHITHGIHSTIISMIGGKGLDMSSHELNELGLSSLLHDVGMMKVPDTILNKKEKLSSDEYNTIKTHTSIGYKLLKKTNLLSDNILNAIIQHHEQYDGKGYPRKLKDDEISIYAKIIAIADAFEAQISKRSYREAKTGYLAMKGVLSDVQNRFDPVILRSFIRNISIYPPGTLVQLNDRSIGIVDSVNATAPLRPNIRLIIDNSGHRIEGKFVIELTNNNLLYIVTVLDKEKYKMR